MKSKKSRKQLCLNYLLFWWRSQSSISQPCPPLKPTMMEKGNRIKDKRGAKAGYGPLKKRHSISQVKLFIGSPLRAGGWKDLEEGEP